MAPKRQSEHERNSICPEHLRKVWVEHHLWERAGRGEFDILSEETPIVPFTDQNGSRCEVEETWLLVDRRFPPWDHRHQVVRALCYRTDDGLIAGTGIPDAKEITIDGRYYRELSPDNPRCALCEGGDLISPWRRQVDSTYRPGHRIWHGAWRMLRIAARRLKAKSGPTRAALGK